MQTPYEIGDTLWLVYPWEDKPIEAKVSMMTVKADKTWKVRVSYGGKYGKDCCEVKSDSINTFKYGLFEKYEDAEIALIKSKEYSW